MKKLNKKIKENKGMTYVELIVVLGIFSTMTSVVLFNYGDFQQKVDIKVLANDIASKIVEAQKSALSGRQDPSISDVSWKPSYGINFDRNANEKKFIYFANVNDDFFDSSDKEIDNFDITKGNRISKLEGFGGGCTEVNNLTVVFRRPSSTALMTSDGSPLDCDHVEITVSSANSINGIIKIYPSGRIQIN